MLTHAFGAVFDNPDLLAVAVVGDGEAETGPLEGSWKGIQLPQPGARRRGAADPAPQRLQDLRPDRARAGERRGDRAAARRPRLRVHFVAGDEPRAGASGARRDARRMPREDPRDPDRGARRAAGRAAARAGRRSSCARRRAGPGRRWSTAFRSRGPSAPTRCRWQRCGRTQSTWRCSRSGCAATEPRGALRRGAAASSPSWQRSAPEGERRMGANPHANGGRRLVAAADCPTSPATRSR